MGKMGSRAVEGRREGKGTLKCDPGCTQEMAVGGEGAGRGHRVEIWWDECRRSCISVEIVDEK